jgi:hypothetical protein
VRLDEVRPAEVRPVEIRLGEVLHGEVRAVEVRTNGGLFCPPTIPDIDALQEEFEMLCIGHWLPAGSTSVSARPRQPPS